MLKNLVSKSGNIIKLLTALENTSAVSVFGCNNGEKLALIEDLELVLYVANSIESALEIFEKLSLNKKNCRILLNKLDYNYTDFVNSNEITYAKTLFEIINKEVDVLVITPEVLLSKLPSFEMLNDLTISLEKNKLFNLADLKKSLIKLGYRLVDTIASELDFSVKGDILNIFPIDYENPVRVSFFDNEIEYIKQYEINTLNAIGEISKLNLFSLHLVNNDKQIKLEKCTAKNRDAQEKCNNLISQVMQDYENYKTSTWLFPYLNIETSILKYFENGYVVFDSPKQIINSLNLNCIEIKKEIESGIECGTLLPKHKNFYFDEKEALTMPTKISQVAFQNINNANNIFKPNAVFNIQTTPVINYNFYSATLISDVCRFNTLGYTIILYVSSDEMIDKLKSNFLQNNIEAVVSNSVSKINKNCVNLLKKDGGYTYCFNEEKLLCISLNNKKKQSKVSNNNAYKFNGFLPEINSYVVHNSYGIGKCVALTKLKVNNAIKDYIEIEYKNSDKLFLPVENIDSITKYVGADKTPKLNKLGSNEFLKTKQKVKAHLKELSINLKTLYAKRSEIKGITYPKDDDIQLSFENNFSFPLTIDQEKAINEVKQDMCSPKVMDRLICGDVGFGKTEVAIRAAFKAIMAGYQVIFLCPTTILSMQHYNTVLSRMQNYGVRVEVLNRFKTLKETKFILDDLANGKIDIICGTHRILSSDVKLKNLGLLILDEEQRFGVEHKEKIKNLKNNIDVLTLSATPIPRTMHIALIGVKDISTIETAPVSRIPVVCQVCEKSNSIIKSYIDRELSRGGQILIVYNNIQDIFKFSSEIKSLVDENVVVDVAHGQMHEKVLEDSIFKLYNGTTQILISTTLIENGIDLPNANTLIVISADTLGLSQLYQLKGRIGRSDKQAYALFTHEPNKPLTEEAFKRLEAIMEYSGLGNGFKIAMRDLEIRGAGSVFGAEQSGHIESVGYSMYVTLLNEAINELNGKPTLMLSDVKIDCNFDAYLPNYFVDETKTRIEIYTLVSKLNSEEEQLELLKQLEFNYGIVPNEVINLCYIARIKNIAKNLDITKISIGYKETTISFNSSSETNLQGISKLLEKNNGAVLNLMQLPIITLKNNINIVDNLKKLINSLLIINNN